MAFGLLLSLFGLVNDGYIIRYSKKTAQEIFVQVGLMGVGRFWWQYPLYFKKLTIKIRINFVGYASAGE
jgi:hypothetical protein